jgi:Tfp pilus assembly protein PilO
MAALETLRDKWDGITPRERLLVVILGVSLVVTLFGGLVLSIGDRLAALEKQNARMRQALGILQDYRVRGRATAPSNGAPPIGKEPVKLESYLERAADRVGIKVPQYRPRTPHTKPNGFVTHAVELQVNGLTIDQVKDFLEAIESDNKLVTVTNLRVNRSFSDREKLDVKMEVSTYSNPNAPDETAAAGAP